MGNLDRRHIHVLTRFAVIVEDAVHYEGLFTEEWFEFRLDLLSRFATPSLKAQSHKDFSWYLFLSEEFPRSLDTKIVRATEGMGCPIRQRRGESIGSAFRREVAPSSRGLFTVRMDSDDSLGPRFLEEILDTPVGQIGAFPIGLGLDVQSGRSWAIIDSANAFMALNSSDQTTIYELGDHNLAYQRYPIHVKFRTPMWMQVTHGKNLANKRRKHQVPVTTAFAQKVLPSIDLSQFKTSPRATAYLEWALNFHKFLFVLVREISVSPRSWVYRALRSRNHSGRK